LLKLTHEISECHRQATEAHEHAEAAAEPMKRAYLDLERRWLALAHSYEVVERLSDFTVEARRRSLEVARSSLKR
jgi:hypothetical protein